MYRNAIHHDTSNSPGQISPSNTAVPDAAGGWGDAGVERALGEQDRGSIGAACVAVVDHSTVTDIAGQMA